MVGIIQCALKGQKHLAQGNTLGKKVSEFRPERAKASHDQMLLPFQGDLFVELYTPGCCPGLGAFALSGRILAVNSQGVF